MAGEGVADSTINVAKAHPYLIGALLVGVLAFVFISRSKGSGGTQISYSVGPTASQTEAATALQIAQVQANAASFQTATNASVESAYIANAAALANDTLSAQTGLASNEQQIGYQEALQQNAQNYQLAATKLQIGYNESLSGTKVTV